MKNILSALLLIPAMGLAGCSTGAIKEADHSNRAKYTHTDGDTKYNYLCEKQASAAKTEAQAKAAHDYVVKRSASTVEETMVGAIVDGGIGNSILASAFNAAMTVQSNSAAMSKEVEAKFRCAVSKAS